MSSTQHKSLARSIEQWQNCDPHAMATRQSYAAIENAFVDAKHDVMALSTEVAALKAQRDELLRWLQEADIALEAAPDSLTKSIARKNIRALIAKHAGIAS